MDTGLIETKSLIENSINDTDAKLTELLKLIISSKSEKFHPFRLEFIDYMYYMKEQILCRVDFLSKQYLKTIEELMGTIETLKFEKLKKQKK